MRTHSSVTARQNHKAYRKLKKNTRTEFRQKLKLQTIQKITWGKELSLESNK